MGLSMSTRIEWSLSDSIQFQSIVKSAFQQFAAPSSAPSSSTSSSKPVDAPQKTINAPPPPEKKPSNAQNPNPNPNPEHADMPQKTNNVPPPTEKKPSNAQNPNPNPNNPPANAPPEKEPSKNPNSEKTPEKAQSNSQKPYLMLPRSRLLEAAITVFEKLPSGGEGFLARLKDNWLLIQPTILDVDYVIEKDDEFFKDGKDSLSEDEFHSFMVSLFTAMVLATASHRTILYAPLSTLTAASADLALRKLYPSYSSVRLVLPGMLVAGTLGVAIFWNYYYL